jgi:hypothetical protein
MALKFQPLGKYIIYKYLLFIPGCFTQTFHSSLHPRMQARMPSMQRLQQLQQLQMHLAARVNKEQLFRWLPQFLPLHTPADLITMLWQLGATNWSKNMDMQW